METNRQEIAGIPQTLRIQLLFDAAKQVQATWYMLRAEPFFFDFSDAMLPDHSAALGRDLPCPVNQQAPAGMTDRSGFIPQIVFMPFLQGMYQAVRDCCIHCSACFAVVFAAWITFSSSLRTSRRSPTMPTSALSKIGACRSVLIAAMNSLLRIPT